MATEQEQSIVTDAILEVFGSDKAAFVSALTRMKLQAELAAIESDIRNKQAEAGVSNSTYAVELDALAVDRAAKVAEIDAL